MNFDAAAIAYIRYVLEETNQKPGGLAAKAGIAPSTLTRALNDPNHKFKLSMTTLEKIAEASGINPAPFLEAKDVAELSLGAAHRADFYLPGSDNEKLNKNKIDYTLLIGEIAAGQWKEPSPFAWYEWGALHIRSTLVAPKDAFAYVMRDDSADLFAANGDILFCTRITDKGLDGSEKPFLGWPTAMAVVVERRSLGAFEVETTLRVIRRRKDGVEGWEILSACSQDYAKNGSPTKKQRLPRVYTDTFSGNDEYRVIGEVQHVIRGDTTDALNHLQFDVP